MTDDELKEIEARANAATKGPWWVERQRENQAGVKGYCALLLKYRWNDVPSWLAESSCHADSEANFAFLSKARDDIPALIAEVRRLLGLVDKLPRDAVGKPIAPDMTCYYLSSHGVQKTTAWKVLGYGVETLGGHTLPATGGGVVSMLYTDRADAERAMMEAK